MLKLNKNQKNLYFKIFKNLSCIFYYDKKKKYFFFLTLDYF
jgi:hypothetical protein